VVRAHYLKPGERVYFYQKRVGGEVEKIVGVIALSFEQASLFLFGLEDGADYWPLSYRDEQRLFESNERRYPQSYKHYLRATETAAAEARP
jgi:hypothetical protein